MASGRATAAPIESIGKFPLPRAHPCLKGRHRIVANGCFERGRQHGTWNVGRCRTWVM